MLWLISYIIMLNPLLCWGCDASNAALSMSDASLKENLNGFIDYRDVFFS
jgi:hypothetical protein